MIAFAFRIPVFLLAVAAWAGVVAMAGVNPAAAAARIAENNWARDIYHIGPSLSFRP